MIIEYLQMINGTVNGKIGLLITALSILLSIDLVIGTVFAKLNKDVEFTSYKMKTGIIVKITELILAVIAVPFAVMIDGGIQFLFVGLFALCGAEAYSILGHLKIVSDNKQGLNVMENLLGKIFGKEEKHNDK